MGLLLALNVLEVGEKVLSWISGSNRSVYRFTRDAV
jgi:hypothetical protein